VIINANQVEMVFLPLAACRSSNALIGKQEAKSKKQKKQLLFTSRTNPFHSPTQSL